MRTTLLAILTLTALGAGARWACATGVDDGAAAEHTLPPVVVRASAPEVVVELKLFRFQPDTVRVPVGTRVVWANLDDIAHSVVSGTPERPDGRVALRLPSQGDRAGARFDEPGRYAVHCDRHPFMQGTIHVTSRGEQP